MGRTSQIQKRAAELQGPQQQGGDPKGPKQARVGDGASPDSEGESEKPAAMGGTATPATLAAALPTANPPIPVPVTAAAASASTPGLDGAATPAKPLGILGAMADYHFAERLLGPMAEGLEDRSSICWRIGVDPDLPLGLDVPVAPVAPDAQAPSSPGTAADSPRAAVDSAPESEDPLGLGRNTDEWLAWRAGRDCSISPLSVVTSSPEAAPQSSAGASTPGSTPQIDTSLLPVLRRPVRQAQDGVTQQIDDTSVRSRKRRRRIVPSTDSASAHGAPAVHGATEEVPAGAASGVPAGGGDGDSGGDAPGAPGLGHHRRSRPSRPLPPPPRRPRPLSPPPPATAERWARSDVLPPIMQKCRGCNFQWIPVPIRYCRRCKGGYN